MKEAISFPPFNAARVTSTSRRLYRWSERRRRRQRRGARRTTHVLNASLVRSARARRPRATAPLYHKCAMGAFHPANARCDSFELMRQKVRSQNPFKKTEAPRGGSLGPRL